MLTSSSSCSSRARFLLFAMNQVPTIILSLYCFAVNTFAVRAGKHLWKVIQQTHDDLQSSIQTVTELVEQMQLLSQIYNVIEDHHDRRRRLERLVASLVTVARSPSASRVIAVVIWASGLVTRERTTT